MFETGYLSGCWGDRIFFAVFALILDFANDAVYNNLRIIRRLEIQKIEIHDRTTKAFTDLFYAASP